MVDETGFRPASHMANRTRHLTVSNGAVVSLAHYTSGYHTGVLPCASNISDTGGKNRSR